jgi:hypothetical protein
MSFGQTTQLLIEVGADGITGTRTMIVSIPQVETDASPVATRDYSFEVDLQGWTVTSGIYTRQTPGANGTNFHMASSSHVDNECDVIDSPAILLTASSTLSLYVAYDTEHPAPTPYDRANVGIRDLNANTRTTIVPTGGQLYNLAANTPNGTCVTSNQAGWAGTSPGFPSFLQTSWTNAALTNGGALTGKVAAIEVGYGTDGALSGAGLEFDEVTLNNFDDLVPDAQSDTCTTIVSVALQSFTVDSGGNGILEPGEAALFSPTWKNVGNVAITMTGAASNFTGPGDGAGVTYSIPGAAADYGAIAIGASQACTTCYSLQIDAATRPIVHWDATVDETVTPVGSLGTPSGGPQVYTLHVGHSFTDVDPDTGTDPFYPKIETILHNGVTGGCGDGTTYCPLQNTLRQEMAVFLLKGDLGAGYVPPACTPPGVFTDVPCPGLYTDFIEDLKTRGITAGCGDGTTYCPDADVLRQEMAVFLLKTLMGGAYVPPACTPPGIFGDVPCPGQYTDFIEDLKNRGITAGCHGGVDFCPTDPVTRQEMAAFLTNTFSLVLYGP